MRQRRVFAFDFVQSDLFLCQPTNEYNRETFVCESDHSRLATIIVDVPVAVENLPVVWMAYKLSCPDWEYPQLLHFRSNLSSQVASGTLPVFIPLRWLFKHTPSVKLPSTLLATY